MKNMVDYVRSFHEPFSDVPLSDVDSLVLCELTYLRFECCGLADDPSQQLELRHLRKASCRALYNHIHTKTQLWELVHAVSASPRYAGLTLSNYTCQTDVDAGKQFCAATYLLEDGTLYVAFRGTDTTMAGWKENLNMACASVIPFQLAAVEYLNMIAAAYGGRLCVGGHSKGGNLSVYASSCCAPSTQERILSIYNHDGPGFHRDFFRQDGYRNVRERISRTVPEASVIGLLMHHDVPYKVIESKERGILQHSAMTWVIHGEQFSAKDDVDEDAIAFAACLNGWLDSMDAEERKTITGILYQIISASTPITVYEIFRSIVRKEPLPEKLFTDVAPESRKLLAEKVQELRMRITEVRERAPAV